MERVTNLVHKRNILVGKFSWGFVAVAMLAGLLVGNDPVALLGHPIIPALGLGVILAIFIFKKYSSSRLCMRILV